MVDIKNIALNLYSFGYYGGFIKDPDRSRPILGLSGLIRLVKQFGLGGIEIPFDHFFSIDKIRQGVEQLEKVRSEGLSVFIDLEKTDLDYIKALLPYVAKLGITAIRIKMDQVGKTIYGGNRYKSTTFHQSINEFEEILVTLLPSLEQYQISLAIENHQDFHSSELAAISNNISEDFIGLTWDVGNSASVIDSPDTFYQTAGHLIRNVHLKDYKIWKSKSGIRLVRCPLGQGYVDFPNVIKKLESNQRIVNMSIELGAQIPRECDINNRLYWETFSDISIDKEGYLGFVDQHSIDRDNVWSEFNQGLSEDEIIEGELKDIEISVSYLKQLSLGTDSEE